MWTKTCQWEKQLRRLFAGPQLALPISQRTDVHDPDLCDNRGLSRICSTTRAVLLQAPCTRSTPLTPANPPESTAIVLFSSVSTLPKQKVMAFSSLVDTTRHDTTRRSTAQHSTAQHSTRNTFTIELEEEMLTARAKGNAAKLALDKAAAEVLADSCAALLVEEGEEALGKPKVLHKQGRKEGSQNTCPANDEHESSSGTAEVRDSLKLKPSEGERRKKKWAEDETC